MIITKLERQKSRRGRWSVFVDNEFVFGLDEADVLYYKLREGGEISPERLKYLNEQVVLVKASQKALDFLARRPRTVKEIEQKLSEEYAPDITARVTDMLNEYNYTDDASYAAEYVKERLNAGYGPVKIEWELRGRGISQELIDTALEQSDKIIIQSAVESLRVKYRNNPVMDDKEKARAYNFLLRRGFDTDTVEEAIRFFLAK